MFLASSSVPEPGAGEVAGGGGRFRPESGMGTGNPVALDFYLLTPGRWRKTSNPFVTPLLI